MIPNVRKALIFGCQNSYNNNFKAKEESKTKNRHLSLVHSDMNELYDFLDDKLGFTECKIFKDEKDSKRNNESSHYPTIIEELK